MLYNKQINNKTNKMRTTQKGTEGILNKVCERYGCNAKKKTISIQQLKRYHKPNTAGELKQLIESHHKDNKPCKCGCIANGGLEEWSQNLFQSYVKYTTLIDNNAPYKNIDDCRIFMNALFIKHSIIGGNMENKCLKILSKNNKLIEHKLTVKEGNPTLDFKYAVDLVIVNENGEEICGIQVKPNSYKYCSNIVKEQNNSKNKLYGKPVFYVYYKSDLTFIKYKELASDIIDVANKYKTQSIPKVKY